MRDLALICDPNPSDRADCSKLLRSLGFEVRVADNGIDCDWVARTQDLNIILISIDTLWGGVEGVMKCLDEREGGQSALPLIVMGDPPVQALSSRTGLPATRCLQKPLRLAELSQAMAVSSTASSESEAERPTSFPAN